VYYTPMIQTLLGLRRTQELTMRSGPLTLIA
jgi:hypothetical protein